MVWGDYISLEYGKPVKDKESSDGAVPVYGTNGQIGTSHLPPLCNIPSFIVGRKGAYRGIHYSSAPFSVIDTAFYALPLTDKVNMKWAYYKFLTYDINRMDSGSAIPSTDRYELYKIPVDIPDLDVQGKIVAILDSINEKIGANIEINENLEQQAAALFKSWFLDYDPWDGIIPDSWTTGKLGDFADIKRGGSPRPIQEYLSDSGLRWLKISDVTSLQTPFVIDIKDHIIEEGLKKTVFLKAGSLVLSNSATPGVPKILDVDSCIHDGWLYFPVSKFSNEYLYLYFKYIRQQLVNLSNGSVFNNLKTNILKGYPTTLPNEETLHRFDDIVKPMFLQMKYLTRESHKLAETRDNLLPRLMSGELDVSDIGL